VNSADNRYKSDSRNTDYAIGITAVVIGSISVPGKKNFIIGPQPALKCRSTLNFK